MSDETVYKSAQTATNMPNEVRVKGPAEWDQRFQAPGFAYGETANAFLQEAVHGMPSGQALSLAEGEGRNAVHLARLGHRVTAVDFSAVGRDKARALAHRHSVDLDYELLDLKDLELGIDRWDLIVAVFSQPPAPVRQRLHGQLAQALRPGGHFVLESKVDADHGPLGRYPGVRHLCAEMTGLEVLHCEEADRELSEGHFHVGLHRTARIVARRPALPKSSDGVSGGTGGGTLRSALLCLALALTLAAGPESARATPNAPPAGITWMPIAGASSGPVAFEIARTETTVAQFRRFVQATGTVTRAERAGGGQVYEAGWTAKPGWTWARPFGVPAADDEPAVHVDFQEAQAFCRWAGGRLPTDAEWVRAAYTETRPAPPAPLQRGRTYPFPTGDSPAGAQCLGDCGAAADARAVRHGANLWRGRGHAAVTATPAGVNGLHDMGANAWEWVDEPPGAAGSAERRTRGGSWWYGSAQMRADHLQGKPPETTVVYIGFRCARGTGSTP